MATVTFAVFSFIMLPVKNGYILRWIDEMSLFESGSLFWENHCRYPGGVLQYAGTWLTQFMYYPWLGSAILIALWIALTAMCARLFRLPGKIAPLTLLPAMFLLLSVVSLDEAWLSLNYNGYLFAPTIGFMTAAATAMLNRALRLRCRQSPFLFICSLLYPWLGAYILFGIAISLVENVINDLRSRNWHGLLWMVMPAGAVYIIPQLYYLYFPATRVDDEYLYLKGLPELMPESYDLYLWLPFICTAAVILILFFAGVTMHSANATELRATLGYAAVAIVFATGVWVYSSSRKSEQFRATVLMVQHIDAMQWHRIIYIMQRIKEPPTFTMRVIDNLAHIKLGAGEESVTYRHPETPNPNPRKKEDFLMTSFVNVPVYYHIGNTNASYRWAMEHTVKYGRRAFYLKYMVRNSIKNGELLLARKYNDILLNTMFHRSWAEHFARYINHPELIKDSPEFNSIPENMSKNLFVN